MMKWRLLSLPRHRVLCSAALVSAADVAGEIAALLAARDFGASVKRAKEFLRSDVPDLYRTVATALWRAGRGADAVEVLGEMADMGVEPNRSTYNLMLEGCLKTGDRKAAFELRSRMKRKGMKVPDKLRRMLEITVKAGLRQGNEVIEICLMADDVDAAVRRVQLMCHDGTAGPNSYTMVIRVLWEARRLGAAKL
ncbi:hypothetical protein BAE44_0024328 [Dichanthelium oligosanthes]|uniref:Pentatricopeptide repeat-containing protein n=1 Tax=Dichanthelium oligosanthes TaxID=888268 RepID=A0A1E5UP43_9POAL|nr:hypothetical protein BAE44_0024328 [Dichanthelium oligosanthes]